MTDQRNLTGLSTNARTRRQMIGGSAVGLGSFAIAGAQEPKTIITTRAIHQVEDLKAGPQRIYEALLDSKQFSAFSGGRAAEIHREVGGAFSLFAGHIVGRNLELLPNRRIVQAWRAASWPEGIYSIARFELLGQGSGTRVMFDHTGFSPELAEHLESGWNDNYCNALQQYVGY